MTVDAAAMESMIIAEGRELLNDAEKRLREYGQNPNIAHTCSFVEFHNLTLWMAKCKYHEMVTQAASTPRIGPGIKGSLGGAIIAIIYMILDKIPIILTNMGAMH